jgi:hypothetical protein
MKRVAIIILSIALISSAYSQANNLDEFFDKYSDMEGITVVNVAGSVQIISVEDEKLNGKVNFFEELEQVIKGGEYTEIMRVKEEGDAVLMLTHNENGGMLMIVGGEDNAVIKLADGANLDNLEELLEGFNIEADVSVEIEN